MYLSSLPRLHLFRDNAWSLQPRSGPDHPCVCLPRSHGRPVFFCGPAHKGEEQTQAQKTQSETAVIPPAAADNDDWKKPHSLTGTTALNYFRGAGFIAKAKMLLKGQLLLSSSLGA